MMEYCRICGCFGRFLYQWSVWEKPQGRTTLPVTNPATGAVSGGGALRHRG
jgi:hypothetical protein